jgi:hypothetical protein
VIFIEAHGFDFAAPFSLPAAQLLVQQGYALRDKIGENLLFQSVTG